MLTCTSCSKGAADGEGELDIVALAVTVEDASAVLVDEREAVEVDVADAGKDELTAADDIAVPVAVPVAVLNLYMFPVSFPFPALSCPSPMTLWARANTCWTTRRLGEGLGRRE